MAMLPIIFARLSKKVQEAGGVPKDAKLFYIRDARQVVGNCALWWAVNGAGYTCELDQAGVYTYDEAFSGRRATDIPYEIEEVEKLVVRHVRLDHLRERVIDPI